MNMATSKMGINSKSLSAPEKLNVRNWIPFSMSLRPKLLKD
jgi:hypothetical protein